MFEADTTRCTAIKSLNKTQDDLSAPRFVVLKNNHRNQKQITSLEGNKQNHQLRKFLIVHDQRSVSGNSRARLCVPSKISTEQEYVLTTLYQQMACKSTDSQHERCRNWHQEPPKKQRRSIRPIPPTHRFESVLTGSSWATWCVIRRAHTKPKKT